MERLTRGQLAKRSGVNAETVRFYERTGLLPIAQRSESNYRLFQASAVERIRFIKRAQELGFSLRETRELLALCAGQSPEASDFRERAVAKIAEISGKIRALSAMKAKLTRLVATCPGRGAIEECPILLGLKNRS